MRDRGNDLTFCKLCVYVCDVFGCMHYSLREPRGTAFLSAYTLEANRETFYFARVKLSREEKTARRYERLLYMHKIKFGKE